MLRTVLSAAPQALCRASTAGIHATTWALFWLLLPLSVTAAPDEPIEVGSISDLDLSAVRQRIERSGDAGAPVISERRALSLEESVKTALEQNLDLQIAVISTEVVDEEVAFARSKFHPVAGAAGSAEGTKRGHSNPLRQDETSSKETALLFLRQEVPTGGNVVLGTGYERNEQDQFFAVTGRNDQTSSQLGGLSIEVEQPLLKGGRVFVARKDILDAEYDTEIRRAELRAEILRVTAETKAAYYRVVQAHRQIEVIEQAIERDRALSEASTALFDAGRVSKVDVFSADIRLSNDRARLAGSKADLEVVQNELRRVIGLPVDVAIDLTELTIPFEPVELRLDEWIARAVENRPELVRIRSELDKIELAVRVSKNAKLPGLEVNGAYQPGFDWRSYNWRAGAGFDYQLGNVGAKAKLRQAELERARVRHQFARARRDIDLEVREIEIRLRESIERLKNLTVQVEDARSKGEIARGRFELGLANNLDIINADEEQVRSESALLDALVGYAISIAELEARIAGPI